MYLLHVHCTLYRVQIVHVSFIHICVCCCAAIFNYFLVLRVHHIFIGPASAVIDIFIGPASAGIESLETSTVAKSPYSRARGC